MITLAKFLERLALVLLITICICASWGTYKLLMSGITLVTAPIFLLATTLPLAIVAYGKSINLTYFDALLAALFFGVCMSYLWALYPQAWALQAFWYVACIALYYAVRIYVTKPNMYDVIIFASLIGCISATFMIGEVTNEWGHVNSRLAIHGVNQNFTSYIFAATIYLSIIYVFLFDRHIFIKFLVVLLCAVLTYFVFLLGTRGAIISIALMLTWIANSILFGNKAAPVAFIAAGSASLLLTFGALESASVAIEGLFQRNTSDLSGRLPIWNYARHMIEDNLFTGIGAGAFQFANPMEIGAHNVFLVMLLDTGIFGFLLFVAFMIGGLWPALQRIANPHQLFILGLFTAFFFPIAVSGHMELSPFTWVVLALTFTMLRSKAETVHG